MTATPSARRPGFTLIELLTVIFIIAVLIAILLPALGSVQRSGRRASTQSLLTELTNAAASFQLDNRRLPGYFTQTELGAEDNWDSGAGPGLTALENALLDLSAKGAIATEEPADADAWIEVNPTTDDDRRIWVKADLLGADEGNYFLPGGSALAFMGTTQQPGTITSSQSAGPGLPDLVDPFGQPIIAWIQDESTATTIRDTHDLVAPSSDDHPSRFYWTSNGSMLSSSSLGEQGRDMTAAPTPGGVGSLIGSGAFDLGEEEIEGVMAALLGHPGYPDEGSLASGDYDGIFPRQARGSFIAHSAGPDGQFLAADDNRLGRLLSTDMFGAGNFDITYGVNFFKSASGGSSNRRTSDNGQPATADFLDAFDDLVVSQ